MRSGPFSEIGTRAAAASAAMRSGETSGMLQLPGRGMARLRMTGGGIDHVAGGGVAFIAGRKQRRAFLAADSLGKGTARVEAAAGGRIDRIGRIAGDRRLLRAPVGIE